MRLSHSIFSLAALGLAMAHGFAEQSRGRLILHSQKGKGTTAELWLPIADPSTQAVGLVQGRREVQLHLQRVRLGVAADHPADVEGDRTGQPEMGKKE